METYKKWEPLEGIEAELWVEARSMMITMVCVSYCAAMKAHRRFCG
jgi:hypothetical protein